MSDAKLHGSLLALILTIAADADRNGQCEISVATLAETIGKKERYTRLLISRLKDLGYLEIIPGTGRKKSQFKLIEGGAIAPGRVALQRRAGWRSSAGKTARTPYRDSLNQRDLKPSSMIRAGNDDAVLKHLVSEHPGIDPAFVEIGYIRTLLQRPDPDDPISSLNYFSPEIQKTDAKKGKIQNINDYLGYHRLKLQQFRKKENEPTK